MRGAGMCTGACACHFPVKNANIAKMALFKIPKNFDAPDRANARTHAQAETANRLLSSCFAGSNKENPRMS